MNWLALSPLEVAAAWAVLSAAALWIYLHQRRPQYRKVSTLRFWASAQPVSQPRRRKLREPWALAAQVFFLLLLLLALGNPRWGVTLQGRRAVIVLDTSIWSQAHPAGEAAWIGRERVEAVRVLDALPARDPVLLLTAEPDAPPILPFTTDRRALRRAIAAAQPSSVAADIPRALEMGKAALAGSQRGLLVYVGPGMVDAEQARSLEEFRAALKKPGEDSAEPQFLMRLVNGGADIQDRGITQLALRRDAAQPDRWHALAQLKNYSASRADVVLKFSVNGQPLGQRDVALAPYELANTQNEFVWDKGGFLQAEISTPDALEADNRAAVSLPAFRAARVAVFTGKNSPFAADLLSVLSGNPYVRVQIVPPGTTPDVAPDVAIYQDQGANVPAQSSYNSIYFLSGPSTMAPHSFRVTRWNAQHPVTKWIRTHDVSVRNSAKLTVLPADTILAYAEGNPPSPLILARIQNGHRLVIVGFDPRNSNFPLEPAFPLFMAGSMEWLTHSVEDAAASASTGELDLPRPVTRIVAPSGREVPFVRLGGDIRLIAQETGIYRVSAPGGETHIAINPPPLPAQRMLATPAEQAGVETEPLQGQTWELWRWLALLAIVALWLEWWLYYSARARQRTGQGRELPVNGARPRFVRDAEEPEESELRNPNFVA